MHGFEIITQPHKERLKNRIFCVLAAGAASLTFWWAIFSVFPLQIEHALVYIGQMISILIWAVVCGLKRGRKTAVLLVLAGCAAFGLLWRQFVVEGMHYILNQYILLRNQFYSASQPLFQNTQEGLGLLFVLFLIQMLLAAVFIAVIYAGKYAAASLALMAVPFALAATVGYMPSTLSGWGIIAAAIVYVLVCRSRDRRLLKKELLAAAAVFAVTALGAAAAQPVILKIRNSNNVKYLEIHDTLVEAQKIDLGNMLMNSFRGNANYAVGGVGKGDLRNLAENRPEGKKKLEIVVNKMPQERVYLKAYVGSEYTGKKWKEPSAGDFRKMLGKAGQQGKGAEIFGEPFDRIKNGQNRMDELDMKLKLTGADSEFAYSPYFSEITGEDSVYADAYIRGEGKNRREYTFYPREQIEPLLSAASAGRAFAGESGAWEAYRAYAEDTYRSLPENLEDLRAYCSEFRTGSPDEVAVDINRRFVQDLSYSLSPGEYPTDKDFAQYFLTQGHEGFCVHFATAATLIYRAQGIPARYVEGYAVPAEAFKRQADGTWKAAVTDSRAHAWSETFDTNLGWIVREHTPSASFSETTEAAASEEQQTQPQQTEEEQIIQGDAENEEEQSPEEPQEDKTQDDEEEQKLPEDTENGDGNGAGSGKGTGTGIWKPASVLGKTAAVVLGVIILLFIGILQRKIRVQNKKYRFRLKAQNRGITNIYNAIYEIAVFAGLQDKEEKEQETKKQMKAMFPQLTGDEWEWIYDCAQRAVFAEGQVSNTDMQKMYKLYGKFRKSILDGMKGRKRISFLYLKGL